MSWKKPSFSIEVLESKPSTEQEVAETEAKVAEAEAQGLEVLRYASDEEGV